MSESLSVRLVDDWWLWRDSAVRAAGFPFAALQGLGQPHLAAQVEAEDAEFRALFEAAVSASCAALAGIVDGDGFRTALLWQNPGIVDEALETFLATWRSGAARNARQRKRGNLLTKYALRYHAKNESIGFFGGVGWARWEDADPYPGIGRTAAPDSVLEVSGSHREIVERRTQVEGWAVRVLAERFSADPATRRWLRPVRTPTVQVGAVTGVGGLVRSTVRDWFEMPGPRYDVLAACDGRSTVAHLAERLGRSVDDVQHIVDTLESARLVSAGIAVPPVTHPDRFLRERLAEIPDPGVRERHLASLDRFLTAADTARQARHWRRLAPALETVQAEFTRATGHRAGHAPTGRGRALLVEDCRVSTALVLGPRLRGDLAEPLNALLTSARWLIDRVAARYLAALGEIHDGLAPAGRVSLAALCYEFWPRCTPAAMLDEAADDIAELQRRWSKILAVPEGIRRHRVGAADIAGAVREHFTAPPAPWASGRFYSPDLMIAAGDVQAVRRGDYEWVLGEMHCGQNTINQGVFVLSHPDPDRLRAMDDEDADRGDWLTPSFPSSWPDISARDYPPPFLVSDRRTYVRFAPEPGRGGPSTREIPIAALAVVRDEEGTLWVEDDTGHRWHPLAALGEFLIDAVHHTFQPIAPAAHRPRISLGRVCVSREQWRVPIGHVTWPAEPDEATCYRAATRWANGLGLPRWVFLRIAGEAKPFCIDLSSPLSITMISAVFRRAHREQPDSTVVITEMYPGPDDLWLGGHTSELRVAVVDRG